MKKIIKIGIFVILIVSLSISGFANAVKTTNELIQNNDEYSFEVVVDSPYRHFRALPGAITTFLIDIVNTGSIDDTYSISGGSIEDIICIFNDKETADISVPSGEKRVLTVSCKIYEEVSEVPLGEWDVNVQIVSQNNSELTENLDLKVNIVEDLPIKISTRKTEYKEKQLFSVTLTNTGDSRYNFIGPIRIFDENGAYYAGFYMLQIPLEPGDSFISPPILIIAEKGSYTFTACQIIDDEFYEDSTFVKIVEGKNKAYNNFILLKQFFNRFPLLERIFNL